MSKLITKELFLTALQCPNRAWNQVHTAPQPLSLYDKFIMEEGLDIAGLIFITVLYSIKIIRKKLKQKKLSQEPILENL